MTFCKKLKFSINIVTFSKSGAIIYLTNNGASNKRHRIKNNKLNRDVF